MIDHIPHAEYIGHVRLPEAIRAELIRRQIEGRQRIEPRQVLTRIVVPTLMLMARLP